MGTTLLLTKIQLKSHFSMSGRSKKEVIFKYIFDVIKFIAMTAIIYVAFYLLSFFRWVSLDGSIPVELLTILMSLMLLLSLVTCLVKITNTLYFSKDNVILLTMPVTKTQLFVSKLLQFLIYELIKNIYFFMPLLISYGIINQYPIGYYFWIIPCWLLFTLVLVSLGGLLSIPYMLISMQFKRYFWLKIILAVILLGGTIFLMTKLIYVLPENIDLVATWGKTFWKIQDFLIEFGETVFIVQAMCNFVVGSKVGNSLTIFTEDTVTTLLIMLAVLVVSFGISIFIIRLLFFKMASYPFEHRASKSKKRNLNKRLPSFVSFVKKEFLITLRTPHRINTLLAFSILTPMAIFLMNRIYLTMNVRQIGKFMIYSFNILMITLLFTSSNVGVSTYLTEEGKCFYITKVNPNSYIKSLLPKMIVNFIIMTISLVATTIVFIVNAKLKVSDGILIFILIDLLYTAHLIWSAEFNVMEPLIDKYKEGALVNNNPNEVKSTVTSFGISLIVALFVFINLTENMINYNIVWIKLIIFALIFLALRIYSYKTHIELYFKEK